MRKTLSKADRSKIADDVRRLLSANLDEANFLQCKTPNLWSKEHDNFIGYIRLKRASKFSEWPHFQMNFGFTPVFSTDIELILRNILKTNQSMYEIWANNIISLTEHYELNTKGVYSSAQPGTWEFRNINEVDKKVRNIRSFIDNFFPVFLASHTDDEFIASHGFNMIDELPAHFRVLQIVSFGNLGHQSRIEDCLAYFRNSDFGKSGSRFKKSVEAYGDPLLSYFRNQN